MIFVVIEGEVELKGDDKIFKTLWLYLHALTHFNVSDISICATEESVCPCQTTLNSSPEPMVDNLIPLARLNSRSAKVSGAWDSSAIALPDILQPLSKLGLVASKMWLQPWKTFGSREGRVEIFAKKYSVNKELSPEDIGLELSTIYKCEDKGKLSKSKALCITKDFFSQSGQVVGADFNERFLKFLSDNP